MTERDIALDDVTLRVLEWGDPSAPLVLLIHGFPDTAHTWRHLGPHLAERGYHVVAPFSRGYAPSSVATSGVYELAAQAHDINALHQALGADGDAVVIGHDWGAAATYLACQAAPERWRKAVTMAVPPPAVSVNALTQPAQMKRSWYMFFFQTFLADFVVPRDDYDFITRLWHDWSPGFDATADVAAVRHALGTPENLGAALGYYRAMFVAPSGNALFATEQAGASQPARVPTLYLHGDQDGCFGIDVLGDPVAHLAEGSAFVTVRGVGHFLQLENPDAVHALVDDFIG
jgi:pimeloyl-ACP methyl ester carboxylesterase